MPHWGYQDGEVPRYEECSRCGQKLRYDRIDLCLEHMGICPGIEVEKRFEAIVVAEAVRAGYVIKE